MKKKNLATIIITLAIIIFAYAILSNNSEPVSPETAKCIGENSELYVQSGCHACETQEKMFGDSYQYLNTFDCFVYPRECNEKEIVATPTWFINGKKYIGVQSIEKLKMLTGCS